MKWFSLIALCCIAILVTLVSVDANGLHVLTLELVLDNCKSDDVHFYIRLTERNNSNEVWADHLGCSKGEEQKTFWTNTSYLEILAGRDQNNMEYKGSVQLPVMLQQDEKKPYTNNTFIFYGNNTQVSFWNRDNSKTFDISDTLDEALIFLKNELCDNISISGLSALCYNCQYSAILSDDQTFVLPMETVRFKVDTRFLYTLRVSKISYNNRQEKCLYLPYTYQEKARYALTIKDFNTSLNVILIAPGFNTFLPLIVNGAVFVLLASVFTFISLAVK